MKCIEPCHNSHHRYDNSMRYVGSRTETFCICISWSTDLELTSLWMMYYIVEASEKITDNGKYS